jgi:tetrahydromethanopterin S-methyltransferase subunit G
MNSLTARLRKCIGITTFKQVEIIPSDVIQKHKIKKDIGIEYGLIFLEEQEFYKKI